MPSFIETDLAELQAAIIDNRGRTCPTAARGTPLIATNCIKDDSFYPVFENVRYVSDETMKTWFRGHPEPGDIIFVCKGSPGRVAMAPNPVNFAIAQDMVALRTDTTKANPQYLYYLLSDPRTRSRIEDLHVGTLIPHFKKHDFDQLALRVHADLGEQQAIAEVLGALDDKIAANRDIESLSLSLINAYYFYALLEGSEIRPALDALSVTFGEAFKGEGFTPSGTGRPLMRIRDISARKSEIWTTERRAGETLVQPGEIVAGMDADFTASAWLGQPSLLNQRVCRITSPWGNAWALSMAQPLLSGITMQKSGTTVIHLNKSDLARSTVRVPTGPSAISMARAAQGLLERLVVAAQESSTLAELRDTLLPALMDGTLRVKDAERTVSEAV